MCRGFHDPQRCCVAETFLGGRETYGTVGKPQALAGGKSFVNPLPKQERIEEHTVDGRNPAPPGMHINLVNNGINYISTGAGFLPSTVVKNRALRNEGMESCHMVYGDSFNLIP